MNKPASLTARNLDLRGLKCPLPALKTQAALEELSAGQELCVETTDPLAVVDIPHLVRQTGDTLLSAESGMDGATFLIRKT